MFLKTELILEMAKTSETISRRDVIELLRVSNNRANYLLRKMKSAGLLMPVVIKGRGAKYKVIRATIIEKCTEIGVRALLTLGGHALLKGHPVELFTRDLIAIATHITSLYEDGLIGYGRHLFGVQTNIQG